MRARLPHAICPLCLRACARAHFPKRHTNRRLARAAREQIGRMACGKPAKGWGKIPRARGLPQAMRPICSRAARANLRLVWIFGRRARAQAREHKGRVACGNAGSDKFKCAKLFARLSARSALRR